MDELLYDADKGGADADTLPFDPLKKYLSEISKHGVLSREEEVKVAEKAHRYKDKEASQKLVASNLRLVVKIALEYYNSYLNILDLIQEGNVGLVHAVKKYNPYKGTRFSTYASFWIRAYIQKHIMDSRSIVKIGTTQNQRRLFYGLNREKRRLEAIGVVPLPQILAANLDVRQEEVEDMEKRLAYNDVSLELPMYEEGDETHVDMITTDENIEEVVADKEKTEILEKKIEEFKKTLSEKALFIFEHRIMADEPKTLMEIGEKFKISRERVRQIENRVLRKFADGFVAEFKRMDF